MFVDFLLALFRDHAAKDAIVWNGQVCNYGWLNQRVSYWSEFIASHGVERGTVTAIEADFSPNSIALMLALIGQGCILVPMTASVEAKKPEFLEVAETELSFKINSSDEIALEWFPNRASHPIYSRLRDEGHPGLVLFSSGSTGKSKAAVHEFVGILEKFKVRRNSLRTLTFLLYDHIGGINTLLYTLSNTGCIVTVQDSSPDAVLHAVEKYRVELLPTSPTFLNLLILSEAYQRHNTATLRTITYGTEPMLESTLRRSREIFPQVTFQQTYGLSEVGILRSKSRSSDSLWVKVGGEGFETRVVDGMLQIKASSAMLGYLNAPSPFTEDGWFITGDTVDVDGEYLRFLGRKSELINVGGEKVHPTEVESTISELTNIAEVTVFGEKNSITGNIVSARIRLLEEEDPKAVRIRVKAYCLEHLQSFKVPARIEITTGTQYSARFKKMRTLPQPNETAVTPKPDET
jgi:long-chain acyl-CoA synthetase